MNEGQHNPANQEHQIEIVQRSRRARGDDAAYWRCSCGETAGGRWYTSVQQALKAADRYVSRHSG